MKNISLREKILIYVSLLLAIFLAYWYMLLNPLLKSIDITKTEVKRLEAQLLAMKPVESVPMPANIPKIKIASLQEQTNLIIDFINDQFDHLDIKMISLYPKTDGNKLIFEIRFVSSYYQLLSFLNAMPKLNTILVIDNAVIEGNNNKLAVSMKLISGYY